MKLGYACINTVLNARTPKVSTNRKMTLKYIKQKGGLKKLSGRILQNVTDLNTILMWNQKNNIKFFRISSDIFSHTKLYKFEDLPDWEQIKAQLINAGEFAKFHGHRITTHPGPYNVLASPKKEVVENTIIELESAGRVMDLLGLSRTPYNKINIHVWASYGDKKAATARFRDNFKYLSEAVTSRLTIENDDKPSLYNVEDLYEMIHSRLGIPIVLDYHHFKFIETKHNLSTALDLAAATWPKGITPVVHYSEGVIDSSGQETKKHSYFIENRIPTFGYDLDIMIEAKGKEQALLSYRKKHGVNI